LGFAYENDDGTTTTNVHLLPNRGIVLSSGDPFPSTICLGLMNIPST